MAAAPENPSWPRPWAARSSIEETPTTREDAGRARRGLFDLDRAHCTRTFVPAEEEPFGFCQFVCSVSLVVGAWCFGPKLSATCQDAIVRVP